MYRGVFLFPSSVILKNTRTVKLLVTLGLVCCIPWLLACEDPVEPEPVTLEGRWEGFVGYGLPPYLMKGDLVLLVDEARTCNIDGSMSGFLSNWGTFELRIAGTLYVNTTNTALGEITITRYRSGIDTVQVRGTMSGPFDLGTASVIGSWESNPNEAFSIAGEWGAMKQ